MATVGKNEPPISGMKSSFLDFSAQMGQMSEDSDYDFPLGFGGGDSISFN